MEALARLCGYSKLTFPHWVPHFVVFLIFFSLPFAVSSLFLYGIPTETLKSIWCMWTITGMINKAPSSKLRLTLTYKTVQSYLPLVVCSFHWHTVLPNFSHSSLVVRGRNTSVFFSHKNIQQKPIKIMQKTYNTICRTSMHMSLVLRKPNVYR